MELSAATVIHVPATLNVPSLAGFRQAIDDALAHEESRALVLVGDERVFCRGLDFAADTSTDARAALETFAACLVRMQRADRPVLAMVEGQAVGGGVGLAAACDVVLAMSTATFALPELLFGLTPAVIFPFLSQRVGLQRLRRLGLTSETLNAEAAREIGLVDVVCEAHETSAVLRAWMHRIRRLDPVVVATWKRATTPGMEAAVQDGVGTTLERLQDPRMQESLRRFAETGEPPWRTALGDVE